MNGLTQKVLKSLTKTKPDGSYSTFFDNCLLIIDEVHNLTNGMAKDRQGMRANIWTNRL